MVKKTKEGGGASFSRTRLLDPIRRHQPVHQEEDVRKQGEEDGDVDVLLDGLGEDGLEDAASD